MMRMKEVDCRQPARADESRLNVRAFPFHRINDLLAIPVPSRAIVASRARQIVPPSITMVSVKCWLSLVLAMSTAVVSRRQPSQRKLASFLKQCYIKAPRQMAHVRRLVPF